MEEINLEYNTILLLFNEIYGLTKDDQILFVGLIHQEISNRLKYDLNEYGKVLNDIILKHEEETNIVFSEHSTMSEHEGQMVRMIPKFKKDENGADTQEMTEEYKLFSEKYNELNLKKYQTFFNKMDKQELDFKSKEVYPNIYEFLVKKEPQK